MRHFFVQFLQHLFPDDLGHQLALRLIRHHAVGKELGRRDAQGFQFVHQLLDPFACAGAQGHHRCKRMGRAIDGHHFQQILFFHRIHFVDDQNAGKLFLFDPVDEHLLGDADAGHRLHQQNGGIHIGHRLVDHFDHVIAQGVPRFVQAGGIQKHQLAFPVVPHTGDPVAGGLGLVAHNGHLGAAQGVGQGGFAHVGPAYH